MGEARRPPLSCFLFILVTEDLSRMTCKLEELRILDDFKVSPREGSILISHLHFADDTIFILGASLEKAHGLKELLIWSEVASGLRINLSK